MASRWGTLAAVFALLLLVASVHARHVAAERHQLGAAPAGSDGGGSSSDLGAPPPPPPPPQQCFPWSHTHSVAGGEFLYPSNEPDAAGAPRLATAGELIALQCDSVVCPNPEVRDCYMRDGVCADDEWCRLEDHLKFGPFGMVGGQTPNNIGYQTCAELQRGGFDALFNQTCGGQANWGPWLSVRGRCEKYRSEEQSCNAALGGGGGGAFGPHYAAGEDGRPPRAALLCGPGLACTGDFAPLPHTCVRARPPDVCFQGPWWDSSSWCKVGSAASNAFTGGLPREELEAIAPALLIQLPTEVFHNPEAPQFWHSAAADEARAAIAAIVQELWPEPYRGATRFPLSSFPDPRRGKGAPGSAEWNATAAAGKKLYRQGNKVWSTIHTLVANTADPMRPAAVQASRALAVWLRQHFMCTNCRGFWGNAVINELGLPPATAEREAHVRWWWNAHNAVSEHTAATRGGHPYVYPRAPLGAFAQRFQHLSPLLGCQNPFFLPYEQVQRMWTIIAPAP